MVTPLERGNAELVNIRRSISFCVCSGPWHHDMIEIFKSKFVPVGTIPSNQTSFFFYPTNVNWDFVGDQKRREKRVLFNTNRTFSPSRASSAKKKMIELLLGFVDFEGTCTSSAGAYGWKVLLTGCICWWRYYDQLGQTWKKQLPFRYVFFF